MHFKLISYNFSPFNANSKGHIKQSLILLKDLESCLFLVVFINIALFENRLRLYFLYGDWKLLRGNEIVYKLRRFVDFGVPLNYYFRLCTFPDSAAQIVANGGRMRGIEERSFKTSGIPQIGGRVASC